MKLSLRWLSDYVDLSGIAPEQIAQQLTMKVSAIDGFESPARELADVRIAHVKSREKHPNADRLSLCVVDTGTEELEVVCGAPNVDAGQRIAYAPVGGVLPGGFKLERRKIRGIVSNGMICSEREMGLGESHDGILVLPEDAPIGEGIVSYLDLDDVVFELDNKDVAHRADLWGLYGFARELAAIFGRELKPLEIDDTLVAEPGAFPIDLQDTDGCPLYLGLMVEGVSGDLTSPEWVARRLRAAEMRPINLLVDLSNYVMLEVGQPTHPFDRETLQGGIVVRRAREGETLTTLDEMERKLIPDDLVIADQERGVAIAGIMGGAPTEVSASTQSVLLESARFDAISVRRTAARLGLRTDAMARFEKFLDPTLPELAVRRYAALLRQLCPEAHIAAGFASAGTSETPSVSVSLRPERARAKLGIPLDDSEMSQHLTSIGFSIDAADDAWTVQVPSWRAGRDVQCEDDLIEEVGRLAGYERAESELPRVDCKPPVRDPLRRLERDLACHLIQQSGYTEVMNYSFASERHGALYHSDDEAFLTVRHPMNQDASRLRRSLVPGLLDHLARNQLHREDLRLVEVGRTYRPGPNGDLPDERVELLAGRLSRSGAAEDLLLEVRADVEALLARTGLHFLGRRPESVPRFAHPERCVVVDPEGQPVGVVAELHPELARAFELEAPVVLCWLDLKALSNLTIAPVQMQEIPQFPAVLRDISLIAPRDMNVADIRDEIQRGGQERIHQVELFDVYQGKGIPDGHRSLAFRIEYRHPDRTLTDKEVDKVHGRVVKRLENKGIELRS